MEVLKSHETWLGLTHLTQHEEFLVRCKLWLPSAGPILWVLLNRTRPTSAYYPRSSGVARHSNCHAAARDWNRLLLDSMLAKHTAAPFLEQKLHQLVGGSSTVVVHDNVHYSDDGNGSRITGACDRLSGLLDVRSLLQRGNWIRGGTNGGLSDLSAAHHRCVVLGSLPMRRLIVACEICA
jgi:hypothetical protein